MSTDCSWTNGSCNKSNWPLCGYQWLVLAPIGFLSFLWVSIGIAMLRRVGLIQFLLTFDAAKVHDPLAQGIAVALSQRKSGSEKRPRLLRYLKLCAMWAEWPSFTITPLYIAFKATNNSSIFSGLLITLCTTNEEMNLILASMCGITIIFLRLSSRWNLLSETLLKRFAYPITFDVFYIPIVSTFLRIGTCPHGYDHISLPSGGTCDCIDKFGVFWAIGLTGFVLTYTSALHYKMYIEPMATTIDFRFQTSFQIIMVMARTLNPIVSMFVNGMDLYTSKYQAVVIVLGLLISASFLLFYAYKTQPCIGSGRIPNNIRVLTFTSTIYTSLSVLLIVVCDGTIDQLYYTLPALPVIGTTAWLTNNKRALLYYIPNLSILDLLHEPSQQANIVGVIAALYMDPMKVAEKDYSGIIHRLETLAKTSNSQDDSLCRAYAIRTLWFCHLENFRKSSIRIGETMQSNAIPIDLWQGKEASSSPICIDLCSENDALSCSKQCQSLTMYLEIFVDEVPSTLNKRLSFSPSLLKPLHSGDKLLDQKKVKDTTYHVIRVNEKNWISKVETTSEAVHHLENIFRYSLEALSQGRANADTVAVLEIAVFLLQWYRTQYLVLTKEIFVEILTSICICKNQLLVVKATSCIYQASIDGTLSFDLWLKHAPYFNQFALVLGNENETTVFECAHVLSLVLAKATTEASINLYVFLVPDSINKIQDAFKKWRHSYRISNAIENCCLHLYDMEIKARQKQQQSRVIKLATEAAVPWLSKLKAGVAQIIAPVHNSKSSITSRISNRLSIIMPPSNRPIALKADNKLPTLGVVSPTLLSTVDKSVSETRLSIDNKVRPPALENLVPACLPGKLESVFVQRKSSPQILPMQTSEHRPSLKSNNRKRSSKLLPLPPIEMSAKEDDQTTASLHCEAPSPFLVQTSTIRITHTSMTNGSIKVLDLAFVPNEIMIEINRRRHLRKRFRELLEQAYLLHHNAGESPRVSAILSNPSTLNFTTQRRSVGNSEYTSLTANIVDIYEKAEDIAMEDFITTTFSPEHQEFFNMFVRPCLKTFVQASTYSVNKWGRWRWSKPY